MTTDKKKVDEEPTARAERKRAGLPVDANPYDNTQDNNPDDASVSTGVMASDGAQGYKVQPFTESMKQAAKEAEKNVTPVENPAVTAPPIVPETKTQKPAENAAEGSYTSYKDILNLFDESPKEKEARRKQMKREAIFNAIADGAAAISNLWATTQGAKSAFDPKESLSQKAYERWERQRKEGEATRAMRFNAALRAKQAEDIADRAKWNEQYQKESLAVRREQLQRLRDRDYLDERKQDWKEKYEQGRLDIAAEKNEIDRAYKEGLLSAKGRELAIKELNAQGYTTRRVDAHGKETVETRTPNGAAGNAGSNAGSGNTGGLGWGSNNSNNGNLDW